MEMAVLGGERKYLTHDHYAGDLVMQLVATLLTSQIIRLNKTLSAVLVLNTVVQVLHHLLKNITIVNPELLIVLA